MSECFINSPLGITKITGDIDGISSISVLDSDEQLTTVIPEVLQDCAYQLQEYFEGKRQNFDLNLRFFLV